MSGAQQLHHVWWSLFELGHINHCSVRWGAEIKADSRECEEQTEGWAGFLRPTQLIHDQKGVISTGDGVVGGGGGMSPSLSKILFLSPSVI